MSIIGEIQPSRKEILNQNGKYEFSQSHSKYFLIGTNGGWWARETLREICFLGKSGLIKGKSQKMVRKI